MLQPQDKSPVDRQGDPVSGKKRNPTPLEILIAGATVLLSTISYLLGSPQLSVVALVIGGISFGIILGTRPPAS
jgi:Flp pilus assembly protein TadB